MKIEQTEETLTTDSQPVTWLGYVGTFIVIGLIWWVAWVPAKLFSEGGDPVSITITTAGVFLGAHAMTFSLLLSLVVSSQRSRFRCRLFTFLLMPLTWVFLGLIVAYSGNAFQSSITEKVVLFSLQFVALLFLWIVDLLIRKARHHGV